MNKWLIIHSIESYCQHSNLIGMNPRRKKNFEIFCQIKKGDFIVYYAVGKLIIGIFKVVSDSILLHNDKYWGDMNVYKIEPILVAKKPPSIAKLVEFNEVKLELVKDTKNWASYLQGKVIVKLSDNDFSLFKDYIENSNAMEITMNP